MTNSFCRTDPDIARHFAHTTFLPDTRGALDGVSLPVLILQCSSDVIALGAVGEYVHSRIADIKEFLDELPQRAR